MNTSDEVRNFTVEADDDGIRVDRWFKRHLPQVGFGTVSKWARTGQVRVDGKRVKPDDRLAEGQQIRVPPGGDAPHKQPKAKRELKPAEIEQAQAMLIERTKGALVLNKPPGLATQGGTNTFNHGRRTFMVRTLESAVPSVKLCPMLAILCARRTDAARTGRKTE